MTGPPPGEPIGSNAPIDEHLADAAGVVVATDFDGTLAPIAERPAAATIAPAARSALGALVDAPRTRVAVVSGRKLSGVRSRVGLDGVRYVGNHGLESVDGGRVTVHPGAERRRSDVARARADVAARLADVPGVAVEDKTLTATVHYRRTPRDRVGAVERAVTAAVEAVDGVRSVAGRQAYELRPAVDWDKGSAVDLLARDGPAWPTVYLGDDATDEDAFRSLGPADVGVLVGDRETAATYRLSDREDVPRLLAWLVAASSGRADVPDAVDGRRRG